MGRDNWKPIPHTVRIGLSTSIFYSMAAGAAGVAVMTLTSKLEQSFLTHRPNSYIPGHTLCRLLNLPLYPAGSDKALLVNHAMHWGQGIVAGAIRGVMAYYGVAGPYATWIFWGIRLSIDQTLENVTGIGALPWTWPWQEQILDLMMKAAYAFTTGYIVDRLVLDYRY
ncbi:hypothetical protein BC832DRAFT_356176 [Gaertneriomyces semiglobifer]|nr:hypothetical protein BC832DRAFT_356176 [Gaertneriomyces semiglobifer]